MGSIPSELSLDCGPTPTMMTSSSERYIPRTIGELISQVSMMGSVSEKLLKLNEYVKRLEDEMRKIDAFKRELPLCMLLLTDAIMALKMELVKYEEVNKEPVLEEFIPLKKSGGEDEVEKVEIRKEKDSRDKMDWMSSVQLWNHENLSSKLDSYPNRVIKSNSYVNKRTMEEENRALSDDLLKTCGTRNVERAFAPFEGCSSLLGSKIDEEELPNVPLLSLDSIGIKRTREDINCGGVNSKLVSCPVSNSLPSFQSGARGVSQTHTPASRKQRRCWSPELHRRFVEALEKLGGCQAATPKQIRELMQVDGLTNDEVKSHLQKYRLHTRRLPATASAHNHQAHVLLGGLWMSKVNHGESTKQRSQSDSPQSPLQFCGGTSMTGGDSMEDEEDERSESHSLKSNVLH